GRRPRMIWTLTTVALIALSLGVFGIKSGQAADDLYTADVGSVRGQRLIDAHYPSGSSYPARIIAAASSADAVVATAAAVPGVATAKAAGTSPDGRWVRVDAVLAAPPDSAAAKNTVDRLRAALRPIAGAGALVGGQTAILLDTARAATRDDAVVMPLILAVVFGVLVLLLRAL